MLSVNKKGGTGFLLNHNIYIMNFYKTKSVGLIVALLLIFNIGSLEAQEKSTVRLLDQDNALAIEGATFEYGNEKGVSDEEGEYSV